jgi:hypothetical protein
MAIGALAMPEPGSCLKLGLLSVAIAIRMQILRLCGWGTPGTDKAKTAMNVNIALHALQVSIVELAILPVSLGPCSKRCELWIVINLR